MVGWAERIERQRIDEGGAVKDQWEVGEVVVVVVVI